MHNIFPTVLAATALALVPLSAQSATLTLGSGIFSPSSCTPVCTGSFNAGPETGTILDTYSFVVVGSELLHTASVTNSSVLPGEVIDPFSIDLFSGTPADGHSLIAAGSGSISVTEQTSSIPDELLASGSYFLEVFGTNAGTPTTYAGSFSFAPSEVPLPASIWLFAIGLIGIAWPWRRRQS